MTFDECQHDILIEHSHQKFLTTVQNSLQLNNPAGIVDSVFGLLGNAAAAAGAGSITVCDLSRIAQGAFAHATCF